MFRKHDSYNVASLHFNMVAFEMFFSLAISIDLVLYLHKYIYLGKEAASARVKWLGINRQVIWLEQSLSNQMWQSIFKRLFSSIKQAACLCQLRVWKKTIQLKRPCMFALTFTRTHTHVDTFKCSSNMEHLALFFLFVWVCFFLCNAAHATFFFFISHICHKTTHHQLYWSTHTAVFKFVGYLL